MDNGEPLHIGDTVNIQGVRFRVYFGENADYPGFGLCVKSTNSKHTYFLDNSILEGEIEKRAKRLKRIVLEY